MIKSAFFTAVAPAALMLSFAIMGGTAALPWRSTLTPDNLITTAAIAVVPFIMDSFASTIEKANYQVLLKRWALAFEELADNIRKFN